MPITGNFSGTFDHKDPVRSTEFMSSDLSVRDHECDLPRIRWHSGRQHSSAAVCAELCLVLFCLITQAQLAADSHIFTGSRPGMQADSVQNRPPNIQESVNQPATIPQKSSSHVPTIAMSPLSQSESLICSFLYN